MKLRENVVIGVMVFAVIGLYVIKCTIGLP